MKAAPQPISAARSRLSKYGEFRVLTLREIPAFGLVNNPEEIADYYRKNIVTDPRFRGDTETAVSIAVNVRCEIIGHYIVANGTLDTILVHPREVFRAAIVANAHSVVLLHNHPSCNPTPSEADIKVTRELIRAGRILKIEVLDHVIMGRPSPDHPRGFCSLCELGYFYK